MKLYKRNAAGIPIEWEINIRDDSVIINHGIVLGMTHTDIYTPKRNCIAESNSRITKKRKEGYKEVNELYDNAPIEFASRPLLNTYLDTYLPKFNTDNNGDSQVMLAKTFEYDKVFKNGIRIGQWKINGLRCNIGAQTTIGDMFKPVRLIFKSREGVEWKMEYLEEYLLTIIPQSLIDEMIYTGAKLDGEIYLPGYGVNEINHFVKDKTCYQHKLLQYWCYDYMIEDTSQHARNLQLYNNFSMYTLKPFISKYEHLNQTSKLVLLPNVSIDTDDKALDTRDKFLEAGFEGLILRDVYAEYQFGKRNSTMIKFKPLLDGLFTIMDIVPEGQRRLNLPKFICRNDINDEYFECKIKGSFADQERYLNNLHEYISKQLKVEYRERSGVKQVPFHAIGLEIK